MCVIVARLDNEEYYSMATIDNCSGMAPANQALWYWFNAMKTKYGIEPNPKNFEAYVKNYDPCTKSWCRYLEGLALVDLPFLIKVGETKDEHGNKHQTFVSELYGQGTAKPLYPDILNI